MLNTREFIEIIDNGHVDIELSKIDKIHAGAQGFSFNVESYGREYKMCIMKIVIKEGKQFARIGFLHRKLSIIKYLDLDEIKDILKIIKRRYTKKVKFNDEDMFIADRLIRAYRCYDIDLYILEALALYNIILKKVIMIPDVDFKKCSYDTLIRLSHMFVIQSVIEVRNQFKYL